MLRDVVAGFLDTVTEREFDAPLMALLAARGFTDVHFLHGAFEFGKDVIAKGSKAADGQTGTGDPATWSAHQYAIQSKAGDLGLTEWRAVRPQLDEARLDGLAHPAFDNDLPRAAVLVTTGRLVGGASVQAQSYRAEERRRGRPDVEIWDRETLLEWLADSPEAGLAGTSDGPILALAGAIDAGQITLAALERHARTWLPAGPDTLQAATDPATEVAARQRRAAVEAAVLGNRLRRRGRLDLAAMTALLLLRAAWCHALATSPDAAPARSAQAQAAARLFAGYAAKLLDQVKPVAGDPQALMIALGFATFPHASYPVACVRIAEILGLLGLLAVAAADGDEVGSELPPADRVTDAVRDLLKGQPGCAHPIGDAFAVSLLAPVLLLARRDPAAAEDFLSRAAVWVADAYDGGRGLAGTWAHPDIEVAYLLGGPFEEGPDRRPVSYLATVLTDLAAVALPTDGGCTWTSSTSSWRWTRTRTCFGRTSGVRSGARLALGRPSSRACGMPSRRLMADRRRPTSPIPNPPCPHGTRSPWRAWRATGTQSRSCDASPTRPRAQPWPLEAALGRTARRQPFPHQGLRYRRAGQRRPEQLARVRKLRCSPSRTTPSCKPCSPGGTALRLE